MIKKILRRKTALIVIFSLAAMLLLGAGTLLAQEKESGPALSPAVTELQKAYRAIARRCLPAVVSIQVETSQTSQANRMPDFFKDDFFRRFFNMPEERQEAPRERKGQAFGSGFLISKDGYLISNAHVVKNARKILVKFSGDDQEHKAEIMGIDEDTDLALLKIKGSAHPYLELGDSESLMVGDLVVAIGNPFGLQSTYTTGVVSATGRNSIMDGPRYQNFIQTDVAINPGNSGGPLLNIRGEVIGINSMIFSQTGGNIGIGFAIPVNMAKTVVEVLKEHGKVIRGWLGIVINDISPEMAEDLDLKQKGVYVPEVSAGGPADNGGMAPGDIITKYNNKPVKESQELVNAVGATKPGKVVNIEVLRRNKLKVLKVKVGTREGGQAAAIDQDDLGLGLKEQTGELGRTELVVAEISHDSPLFAKGIRTGDVLVMFNYKDMKNMAAYKAELKASKKKEKLVLHIRQKNYLRPVVIYRKNLKK